MKTLELADAVAPLAKHVRGVNQEPVSLIVDGKPEAALVAIVNADLETVTVSTHPQFLALIERLRARQMAEGGISAGEMRRRLSL